MVKVKLLLMINYISLSHSIIVIFYIRVSSIQNNIFSWWYYVSYYYLIGPIPTAYINFFKLFIL